MHEKREILEALYLGENFNDCIKRVAPEELRNDLKQEIILRLCEQEDEKIIGLHQRGELEFYTVRIILNEFRNKTNGFAKKYRTTHLELSQKDIAEETNNEERLIREQLEDYTLLEIDKLYWYDSEMIRLYMELGTFRAIQKKTGIPYVSCFKTIKKALAVLKRRAYQEPASRPIFSKTELRTL